MGSAIERELLVALLESTRSETVAWGNLRSEIKTTSEALERFLEGLINEGLIMEKNGLLEASPAQRLKLAVKAVEASADMERVGRTLGWMEFEEMVAHVFEENGFGTRRRFRFTANGRRWEIDVLAYRKPLVACAECKHWTRGLGNSSALKVAKAHVEKVMVFSENLAEHADKLGLNGWNRAVVVPIAMSLTRPPMRFYERVPAVSILELPSFLSDLEGYLSDLASFPVELSPSKPGPFQATLRR